jgi:hypothetical protein
MSEEMQEFSLADLADIDVSEIEEIRFESLPPGVYGFKVAEADLEEKPNRDGDQRFIGAFNLEVVEVKAVVKAGVDKDSLIGKKHTERRYIVPTEGPAKLAEGIGQLRAFVTDIGCNSEGKLIEIVKNTVDHTFYGKIVERSNKDDPSQKFAQLRLDPPKRAAAR